MSLGGRVVRTKDTLGGAPRLAGTRMPTRAIWQFWQAGYSRAGIHEQYPHLSDEEIATAIYYEARRRAKKKGRS